MQWNPTIAAQTDQWLEATYSHLPPGHLWEQINEREFALKEQYQHIWETHYYSLSRTPF